MRHPSAPSISKKSLLFIAFAFVLVTGAIVSTSSVAQLSYQAAQLQQQKQVLTQRKQYLQEQLAQSHSLATSMAYTQEQGFSR